MTDFSELKQNYLNFLKEEADNEISKKEDLILKFIDIAESRGIIISKKDFNYFQTIGIVLNSENIFLKLNEDITLDKDGLIDFKLLCSKFSKHVFAKGYLYSDNYIAMASHYFRRGYYFENGFEPRFIDKFWNINSSDYEEIKICIDLNHIRIDVDNSMTIELDTWYGAKFDKNIENISSDPIKLRPSFEFDEGDISLFFANVYCLDIKWTTSKNIKTFQAEEIKTESIKVQVDGVDFFPVRYIHAEYDIITKTFRHFDGAIHFYTQDEYFQRRDSDLNHNEKTDSQIKSKSKKIFKINGKIEVNTWIDLCSHFFSHNPLVIEYFEGNYPAHIQEILNIKRSSM
ncbi:hypothetical protein PYS58_06620 [Chryseobacterium indologenes]|uniref:hypothetical protein n=1 Tax=Chryseobacterium indologenes TaxID=253 RepID=UPI001108535B|nr:hypothetical protein [Chryseobacterium indologenes]TLX26633.1 hypothetical protein FE904_07210 [Chryseobacterium indologenes]WET50801.1 hypothetical protein PYS58_06620 [Chryseobacterium indologenes]